MVCVLYHFAIKKSIHLPIFMQICYNAFGGRCYGRKEIQKVLQKSRQTPERQD